MNTIIKRVWNQNRMVNIEDLRGMAFQSEDGGHTFVISGINDENIVVDISGTIGGVFMRPDGTDVALTGSIDNGVASITLSEDCYAVSGRFCLAIFNTNDSKRTCIYACVGSIAQTSYGVVSGGTEADITDLIDAINDAISDLNTAIGEIPSDYTQFMASIAPTFSSTAIYPAGSYVWYNGILYRFITDKSAGSWSSSKVIAIALADDVAANRNAFSNNVEDVLFYSIYKAKNTNGGITVTPLEKNKFHFTGTISGSGFSTLWDNISELPFWLEAGKVYCLDISGATSNNKIYFEILGFKNGSTSQQVSLSGRFNTNGTHLFTIPSNFVGGCYVRIGWLSDNRGTQVNETITYHLYNAAITGKEAADIANRSLRIEYDYNYASCDDVADNSVLFVSSSGGTLAIADAPFVGFLQTFTLNNNIRIQIMYPYATSDDIQYRSRTAANGWSSWRTVGSGATTTTIIQEVSRDTYNNSYDITVNPTITTDSNGWLQPVDTNTSDETGKTDMTSAIMAMLTQTGYCHLAAGIYYVSGNIDMPANSMIEGCGKQTIIRLLQSTQSGYIVRMHTRSTLKNVCLSGGYSAGDISNGNIGGRNGVQYIGNRDGQSAGVTPNTCTLCQIDGCWFENLDSGIYGYNAGGGLQEGLEVVNCYFTRCKAGINIDYWTEYCKFTNCVTFQCYYGCINNGGNNVFTACTFHGVIGFVIDNSSGTKPNTAHGTCNGCTFNHIDNMNHPETLGNGYGVRVLGTPNGFIFANCQFWYSKVYVESSAGVQFIGGEFGGSPVLETSGNETVFFLGCLFKTMPTKSLSSPTVFDNCYTYAGSAVNG